ncbi:methyltransferase [Streptomyces sp. SPB074]|nr:methyltransferase [Streptomyces sp. SPB074]
MVRRGAGRKHEGMIRASSQGLSFDSAAARYAAHRPSYPSALLDAIEELAGFSLVGVRVADVGAGTGLGTRVLAARGARVVGVEPGGGMAAQFRAGLPSVPLVRGDGNALPLGSSSLDAVTYAQSWHWTDPLRSVPEALRVLRPVERSRSGGTTRTARCRGWALTLEFEHVYAARARVVEVGWTVIS